MTEFSQIYSLCFIFKNQSQFPKTCLNTYVLDFKKKKKRIILSFNFIPLGSEEDWKSDLYNSRLF